MQYFPIFAQADGLKILMIGAGIVASRKLELLSRTQAHIRVIAPDVCDAVMAMANQGQIALEQRFAELDDLEGIDLLYMATSDEPLNRQFALQAKALGLWVNVVDAPKLCNFITPAIVDRGRLQVAISTSGAAPVFARELRARLETWLPSSLSELFDFIADKRTEVQHRLPAFEQRKLFWEQFFRLNGDRFDERTDNYFEQAFGTLSGSGELLLLEAHTPIDLLPLAAVPMMQRLDWLCSDLALPERLSELVRRDAGRQPMLPLSELSARLDKGERVMVYAETETIVQLVAHFPMAKHLRPGAL
ncbi:bifunctional precorrin-2 dehydrogenase/sirohydrochlorin ferrochelatase [Shewanella loihica]|uniref:precorrin-2 dehydrogenase n=1 Tax=Shewanella loihica (strain ATCC BAA-1088 / PV-4) TaxID=323850 RepID=A3QFF0_SHELP|nr:bifunctional precorrin-2 dehydrogenase/sirohydrochlorin ferrochelatase [Shewanella loihica]ABO24198.1 siroheme synthase [Shewanella loihica PV-4]